MVAMSFSECKLAQHETTVIPRLRAPSPRITHGPILGCALIVRNVNQILFGKPRNNNPVRSFGRNGLRAG